MSLVTTVQALLNRTLSIDEVQSLNAFQKQFEIDDDDPLMVVLAMMARTQIIVDAAPNLLQQKAAETIELHRAAMRDQAVLIAKDLVGLIAKDVLAQHSSDMESAMLKKYKTRWIKYTLIFMSGWGFGLLLIVYANRIWQFFRMELFI